MKIKKIIIIVCGAIILLLISIFFNVDIFYIGKFLAKSILPLIIFGAKAIAGIILCWFIALLCMLVYMRAGQKGKFIDELK